MTKYLGFTWICSETYWLSHQTSIMEFFCKNTIFSQKFATSCLTFPNLFLILVLWGERIPRDTLKIPEFFSMPQISITDFLSNFRFKFVLNNCTHWNSLIVMLCSAFKYLNTFNTLQSEVSPWESIKEV